MDKPNPKDNQDLLRLLARKRQDTPPPGFFDRLPSRILVNIRAGAEVEDLPWWSRLWEMMVREPMVASSYAALGMGALLFGVSVFETAVGHEPAEAMAMPGPEFTPASLSFPATSSLPEGIIYRATAAERTVWGRETYPREAFQNASFSRSSPAPAEPLDPLSLRMPR